MWSFFDVNGIEVKLSFTEQFAERPDHVFVICRYAEQWLLTQHRQRGYEFPSGKIECGETPEQAAVREVWEETAGVIGDLQYVGQYIVMAPQPFVKNVYIGQITTLQPFEATEETAGRLLVRELPKNIGEDETYSFIMKDEVVQRVLTHLQVHI